MSPPSPTALALRPLPRIHRLVPSAFYGWFIAVAASCISFIVVGVGFYGMGVFLDALCAERGWPRTSVSLATTVYFVTSGLGGSLIGRSVDRQGARYWMVAGSVAMAVALVALGRVTAIPELVAVYFLLACGFAMTGPVPSSALITRWFEGRRARAMSIAQTGVSAGGIVLVPVMTGWIEAEGLAAATDRLALAVVLVVVPLGCFVLRSDPRRHGLEPDGGAPAAASSATPSLDLGHVWTARDTLRSRTFWQLVIAFGGILFCQVAAGMHQLSRLRVDLAPELAALALSTTAFGSLVARLVVGGFADRVDQRRLGASLIGLQSLALLGFSQATGPLPLFVLSLFFGFTVGNLFMLQALIVGRLFGVASFASVLGLLQLITQTTSGLGPYALGLLHAHFGGYPEGYAVLAALAVASGIVLLGVRPPGRPARA